MNNSNHIPVDIVEYISQYITLTRKNGEYVGLCPFHSEKTPSFYVNPTQQKWYCFGCKQGGNIIKFVMQLHQAKYYDAVKLLNSEYNVDIETENHSALYKTLMTINQSQSKPVRHTVLEDSILDNYDVTHIPWWEEEDIPYSKIKKYGVRFDFYRGRIVYPVYDNSGKLINIKGRTVNDNYKELNEAKYINYFKVGTVDYLQCYYTNRYHIASKKEVIIFEGIKSVMKADTFGYKNCVSSETSRLTDEQISFLISLHYDVVIAYDNDVSVDKIKDNVRWLARFLNVYIVSDEDMLLGEKINKMSPVDQGCAVWKQLYNNRKKVKYAV
jgi:DNA primase